MVRRLVSMVLAGSLAFAPPAVRDEECCAVAPSPTSTHNESGWSMSLMDGGQAAQATAQIEVYFNCDDFGTSPACCQVCVEIQLFRCGRYGTCGDPEPSTKVDTDWIAVSGGCNDFNRKVLIYSMTNLQLNQAYAVRVQVKYMWNNNPCSGTNYDIADTHVFTFCTPRADGTINEHYFMCADCPLF